MRQPKPITYDEVMAELEKHVLIKGGQNRYPFTPQMDKLILKARSKRVSFMKIQGLWDKLGWGHIAKDTIRARFIRLENGSAK